MKRALILMGLAACCCQPGPAFAQDTANKAVTKAVDDYIESVRAGQPVQMVPKDLLTGNPGDVLEQAAAYHSDPLPLVRYFAVILTLDAAKSTTAGSIRQKAVGQLAAALNDPEPLVWQHASKYLLEFREEDFDDSARATITANVLGPSPRREEIRIAGIAQITSLLPRLGELLIDERATESGESVGRWYGTVGWAARLARARMGVAADATHAVAVVEAEADDITRVSILLRDLAYVDQPATSVVLRNYVAASAALPSSQPPRPGVPYYQYAIDALAEFALGFPFAAQGAGGYSEEHRGRALAWLDDR